ncbi:tumor necrosis factor receptor superfamily member 19 [Spea bombifrons]|uniref:tumor necrosis factor receptor superfamily member 19 n=1 Tax=Spea bombifrons TaxID=233779 RepID=UPI002349FA4B|nr:tumor necrosis factor receptor superfamily member 19 [Spea bombifrons]XP_053312397.1 tumor necrosis factor receptor superfamily member 19 [Spea bombifrons]
MDIPPQKKRSRSLMMLLLVMFCLIRQVFSEIGDCREQEFLDSNGVCKPCRQCGPGNELSKECGFGYGEDAQCLPCRPNRFKDDWGFQKCKPCLDCATVNRYQKANCTPTGNALCGDCLPGFYRKTKLGGFQDMECVPCGDRPPHYEPHCNINFERTPIVDKITTTASSPRDTALAAVICSALATVLLALLILSVIYCKRQFVEKKPGWSNRSQELQYTGSELSCFDGAQFNEHRHRMCCRCKQDQSQTCGPVHLIPSLCCEDSVDHGCMFRSHGTLYERNVDSVSGMIPTFLGSTSHPACGDPAETRPLMQRSGRDSSSVCEPYLGPTLGDTETQEPSVLHVSSDHDVSGETYEQPSLSLESSTNLESLLLAAGHPSDGKQSREQGDTEDDKQEAE